MRAVELGLDPEDLAALGREHGRPEWVAAGRAPARVRRGDGAARARRLRPGLHPRRRRRPARRRPRALDRVRGGSGSSSSTTPRRSPPPRSGCCGWSPAGAARSSCSATPTSPPRPSAAPTRGCSPTGGRLGATRPRVLADRSRLRRLPVAGRGQRGRRPRSASLGGVAHRGCRGRRAAEGVVEVAPAAVGGPGGRLRRLRAARGAPARRHPVGADGGRRPRRGAHGAAAARAARPGVPVRRRRRAARCATRPPCARSSPCCAARSTSSRGPRRSTPRRRRLSLAGSAVPTRSSCAGCGGRCAAEIAGGGARPSDELLAEASEPSARPARAGRTPARAGCTACSRRPSTPLPRRRPGSGRDGALGDVERERPGRPRGAAALAGGPAGGRADRDLDAVVGLFDAAARFVDRLPAAGPGASSTHVLGQDLPGDTLAARAAAGESVALLTRAGAAGREWDLVVVAGVQEGIWPDLRLRGSLLGAERPRRRRDRPRRRAPGRPGRGAPRRDPALLRRVHPGPPAPVVTAVRSEDEQPSPFLDLVDPRPTTAPHRRRPRSLTLPAWSPSCAAPLISTPTPAPRRRAVALWPGSPARASRAPTRRSGGRCAPLSDDGRRRGRRASRCGSRPRRSTPSTAAPSSWVLAPAGATARRPGPRTSARWSTRSPTSRRHRRRGLRRRARAAVGRLGLRRAGPRPRAARATAMIERLGRFPRRGRARAGGAGRPRGAR